MSKMLKVENLIDYLNTLDKDLPVQVDGHSDFIEFEGCPNEAIERAGFFIVTSYCEEDIEDDDTLYKGNFLLIEGC